MPWAIWLQQTKRMTSSARTWSTYRSALQIRKIGPCGSKVWSPQCKRPSGRSKTFASRSGRLRTWYRKGFRTCLNVHPSCRKGILPGRTRHRRQLRQPRHRTCRSMHTAPCRRSRRSLSDSRSTSISRCFPETAKPLSTWVHDPLNRDLSRIPTHELLRTLLSRGNF